jgi:hypothetical protein
MQENYESLEAVEIGNADSTILGEKRDDDWDQPTMSFVKTYPTVVDVDE